MRQPEGLGDVLRQAFRAKPKVQTKAPVAQPNLSLRPSAKIRTAPCHDAQPKSLDEALNLTVQDPELRILIERSSKTFMASERRVITQSEPVTRPRPPVVQASLAPAHDGLPRKIVLRDRPCDSYKVDGTFVSMQLRAVTWLNKLNCSEVLRKGYTRRVCREAVALVMTKWPGQIQKDECALFFGFADARMKDDKRLEVVEIVRSQPDALVFVGHE